MVIDVVLWMLNLYIIINNTKLNIDIVQICKYKYILHMQPDLWKPGILAKHTFAAIRVFSTSDQEL